MPGKLDGCSVPSGSDARPAAVLVFQPEAGCLIDKHRHDQDEHQQRERFARAPPRLENGAVTGPHHHTDRQEHDDQLKQRDDPGNPCRHR